MANNQLCVLGIDPGLANTGWGVILENNQEIKAIETGYIVTKKDMNFAERLQTIFNQLQTVAIKHQPDAEAVEQIFFAKNTKTAMLVAQARGAAILGACSEKAEFFEYTPLQIKQAVVGRGRAGKEQVEKMVGVITGLKTEKLNDHTTDAVATAICHCNFAKLRSS